MTHIKCRAYFNFDGKIPSDWREHEISNPLLKWVCHWTVRISMILVLADGRLNFNNSTNLVFQSLVMQASGTLRNQRHDQDWSVRYIIVNHLRGHDKMCIVIKLFPVTVLSFDQCTRDILLCCCVLSDGGYLRKRRLYKPQSVRDWPRSRSSYCFLLILILILWFVLICKYREYFITLHYTYVSPFVNC